MQVLITVLGVLSAVTVLISALSVHRLRLLVFGIITGVLVAIEYGLAGAWTGLWSVVIGLTWTVLLALAYRWPYFASRHVMTGIIAAHTAAFLMLTRWDTFTPLTLVPLVAGIAGTLAIALRDLVYTKGVFVVLGVGWLGYEFQHAVYGQMVGESLNLVANIVAFSALLAAKYRGIPRRAMENIDTQLLGVLTGAIRLPHNARALPRRAHPTSVGYARLVAEVDREQALAVEEDADTRPIFLPA